LRGLHLRPRKKISEIPISTNKPGVVVQNYNPSYLEVIGKRLAPGKNIRPYPKYN
jgi:hypothetical protein